MTVVEPVAESVPDLKIAIVVDPSTPTGALANRCAVLATGIAAHRPEVIGADLATVDGRTLLGFTRVPISVLAARSLDELQELEMRAREFDLTTIVFLRRAEGMRSYDEYARSIAAGDASSLDIDSFAVAGPRKAVDRVIGSLPMLR